MAAGGAALLAACGTDDDSAEDASIAGGETLADLSELDVGSSLSVQTSAGQTVLLTRLDEEQVVAFSAVCTHQGCTVEVGAEEAECPCHGSRYDLTTGEATARPATEPLAAIEVEIRDGQVRTT